MEKSKFKTLSELLGKGIEVTESSRSAKKNEEKFFLELLENLCQIEASSTIMKSLGVNLIEYEELHIASITMLSEKYFGEIKTSIIMWWVFESISPNGEIYPLMDDKGIKHVIKTPLQLYKFLKRYDGK